MRSYGDARNVGCAVWGVFLQCGLNFKTYLLEIAHFLVLWFHTCKPLGNQGLLYHISIYRRVVSVIHAYIRGLYNTHSLQAPSCLG